MGVVELAIIPCVSLRVCRNQLKALLAQLRHGRRDVRVGAYSDPLGGAAGGQVIRTQLRILPYGMGFEDTHGVAASQDRGEIVRFVHVVEQHREIGLATVEHPPEFFVTLRCHVPCMRILCSGCA